jgi:hypothetical protein
MACYQECGRLLVTSRWSKVARSEHYRWLHEDPSYRQRFVAASRAGHSPTCCNFRAAPKRKILQQNIPDGIFITGLCRAVSGDLEAATWSRSNGSWATRRFRRRNGIWEQSKI